MSSFVSNMVIFTLLSVTLFEKHCTSILFLGSINSRAWWGRRALDGPIDNFSLVTGLLVSAADVVRDSQTLMER